MSKGVGSLSPFSATLLCDHHHRARRRESVVTRHTSRQRPARMRGPRRPASRITAA